jgi:hypothetical protein
MDPIHPITPGPSAISRSSVPVERLQRISRERDRRHRDELARDGKRPGARDPAGDPAAAAEPPSEEGEGTHIDVRV